MSTAQQRADDAAGLMGVGSSAAGLAGVAQYGDPAAELPPITYTSLGEMKVGRGYGHGGGSASGAGGGGGGAGGARMNGSARGKKVFVRYGEDGTASMVNSRRSFSGAPGGTPRRSLSLPPLRDERTSPFRIRAEKPGQLTSMASSALTAHACTSDDDCTFLTARLDKVEQSTNAFICDKASSTCRPVVTSGQYCGVPNDCMQYHYVQRQLQEKSNLTRILGASSPYANNSDPTAYYASLCSPSNCLISSCDSHSDFLFPTSNPNNFPTYLEGFACCGGGPVEGTCSTTILSTCDSLSTCADAPDPLDPSLHCVAKGSQNHNIVVGIVISLIGASMLNIGLNLQKLALRKRYQKKQKRQMERNFGILQKFAAARMTSSRGDHRDRRHSDRAGNMSLSVSRAPSIHSLTGLFRNRAHDTDAANGSEAAAAFGSKGRTGKGLRETEEDEDIVTGEQSAGASVAPPEMAELGRENTGTGSRFGGGGGAYDTASVSTGSDFAVGDEGSTIPRGSAPRFPHGLSGDRRSGRLRSVIHFGIELPRPTVRAVNVDVFAATVIRPDGTTEDVSIAQPPEEKQEFQKNLNFGNLVKNPIWILGFLIFVFSNLMNFVALAFAPQSLVAPLGSISLVVNVILAPIINNERFTVKDLAGVVLIVVGSSLTIVFAGNTTENIKLCVLLTLFRKPNTVAFLTITIALAFFLFLLICTIEKNLALRGGTCAPKLIVKTPAPPAQLSPSSASVASESTHSTAGSTEAEPVSLAVPAPPSLRKGTFLVSRRRQDSVSPLWRNLSRLMAGRANAPSPITSDGKGSISTPPTDIGHDGSSSIPATASPSTQTLAHSAGSTADEEDVVEVEVEGGSSAVADIAEDVRIAVEEEDEEQEEKARFQGRRSSRAEAAPPALRVHSIGVSSPAPPADDGQENFVVATADHHASNLLTVRSAASSRLLEVPAVRPFPSRYPDYPQISSAVPRLEEAMAAPDPAVKPSMGQRLYAQMPASLKKALDWWQSVDVLPRLKSNIPLDSWVIYWINMGLQRYDALLQVPVFYVAWTFMDVVGGGVYFGEFDGFDAKKYGG
ncbi:NIPA-like protein 3, partial [Irineochytrium annulatum]